MFSVQAVDDDGEGAVASDVAGCAEGVHCDVKGDDECLSLRTEAKYSGQWSQCGHRRSTRHTRCRHHADSQEQDEMKE